MLKLVLNLKPSTLNVQSSGHSGLQDIVLGGLRTGVAGRGGRSVFGNKQAAVRGRGLGVSGVCLHVRGQARLKLSEFCSSGVRLLFWGLQVQSQVYEIRVADACQQHAV